MKISEVKASKKAYMNLHDHPVFEDQDQKYYRTSIWVGHKNMQLYFHQATILNEEIDLIKT